MIAYNCVLINSLHIKVLVGTTLNKEKAQEGAVSEFCEYVHNFLNQITLAAEEKRKFNELHATSFKFPDSEIVTTAEVSLRMIR